MGLDITIGQLLEENLDNPDLPKVHTVEIPDAPLLFSVPWAPRGNLRKEAYEGWYVFCEAVNLTSFFYNDEQKYKCGYPGYFNITQQTANIFEVRREAYEDHGVRGDYFEGNLKTLDWLIFWSRWALEHCEKPVIYLN